MSSLLINLNTKNTPTAIIAKIIKLDPERIIIYPFGGITRMNNLINTKINTNTNSLIENGFNENNQIKTESVLYFEEEGNREWFELLKLQTDCVTVSFEAFKEQMGRYIYVVRKG